MNDIDELLCQNSGTCSLPLWGLCTWSRTYIVPPNSQFDVQILQKRYEHPRAGNKFQRKIFVGKYQHSRPSEFCLNLAVITYSWKGPSFPFIAEDVQDRKVGRPRKNVISGVTFRKMNMPTLQPVEQSAAKRSHFPERTASVARSINLTANGNEASGRSSPPQLAAQSAPYERPPRARPSHVPRHATQPPMMASSNVALTNDEHDHLWNLKCSILEREYENQERLSQLLDRADSFLSRVEMAFGVDDNGQQQAQPTHLIHQMHPQQMAVWPTSSSDVMLEDAAVGLHAHSPVQEYVVQADEDVDAYRSVNVV